MVPRMATNLPDVHTRLSALVRSDKRTGPEWALLLGLGIQSFHDRLKGRTRWTLCDAVTIAATLGTTVDALVGDEDLELGYDLEPDAAGIEKAANGPAAKAALDSAAGKAASAMKSLAGALKSASFFQFRKTVKAIPAEMVDGEMTAFVGSDSPGWHLQEFGTAHEKPKAIIRRGMKQSGIRFEEGSG